MIDTLCRRVNLRRRYTTLPHSWPRELDRSDHISAAASMPHHAHATMRALELVVAVVDATTAMDVVEALRHTPELLHALGEAVADAQARLAR